MTDPPWFHRQLQSITEEFFWAVRQIPPERHFIAPRPGKWPVARLVYHMLCYDQRIALPTLHQWTGGPRPVVGTLEEDAASEEANWQATATHDVQAMLTEFQQLRTQQLALLQQLPASAWQEERRAIWRSVTLQWAVTKTYQHTLEHSDELLRMYLWWK